jgi:hypothetical protein
MPPTSDASSDIAHTEQAPGREDTAKDTQCHVVRLYVQPDGEPGAQCLTLPEPTLAEIRESTLLHRQPYDWAKKLDEIRAGHRLPGLAVWFSGQTGLPPSAHPLPHPFEPILLDERNSRTLRTLLDAEDALPAETSRWVRAGAVRGWLLKWGGVVLSLLLPAWLVAHRGLHTTWLLVRHGLQAKALGIAGVVCVVVVLFVLFGLWDREWFLIPRGLLLRSPLRLFGRSLERATRDDSALLIRPAPRMAGWSAYICCGRRVQAIPLTDLEAIALFAAWQSPAPAPELSALADYR